MSQHISGRFFSDFRAPALSFIISLILVFILAAAGTWPGLINRSITLPSLALITLLVGTWFMIRQGCGSKWHRTPVDVVLPVWGIACAISTLANPTRYAAIAVGLWFASVYILAWYLLCDVLANRLLDVNHVVDGLLIAGIPVLGSALLEGLSSQPILRLAGLMQNPNLLGAFLVILIPITTHRLLSTRSYKRAGYGLLLITALITLALSQSRGGALGVGGSFGLMLFYYTPRRRHKAALLAGSLVLGLVLVGTRGDSGRLRIYEQAVMVIESKLWTGQGLFTFRAHAPARWMLHKGPPNGQNLHAHNIVMQIVAELGFVGLAALAMTAAQFVRWSGKSGLQLWCLAAAFGLFAQQMVDFTLMTPSIALCTIIILSIAVLPSVQSAQRDRRPVFLFAALAIVLMTVGLMVQTLPRTLL